MGKLMENSRFIGFDKQVEDIFNSDVPINFLLLINYYIFYQINKSVYEFDDKLIEYQNMVIKATHEFYIT